MEHFNETVSSSTSVFSNEPTVHLSSLLTQQWCTKRKRVQLTELHQSLRMSQSMEPSRLRMAEQGDVELFIFALIPPSVIGIPLHCPTLYW